MLSWLPKIAGTLADRIGDPSEIIAALIGASATLGAVALAYVLNLMPNRKNKNLRPPDAPNETGCTIIHSLEKVLGDGVSLTSTCAEVLSRHLRTIGDELRSLEKAANCDLPVNFSRMMRDFYEYSGDYGGGIEFGETCKKSLKGPDRILESFWIDVKCIGYLLILDEQYEKGRDILSGVLQALASASRIDEKSRKLLRFYCHRYRGISYLRASEPMQDLTMARDCFENAKLISCEFDPVSDDYYKLYGRILGNLGNLELESQHPERAIDKYKESLECFLKLRPEDLEHLAVANLQLAQALIRAENIAPDVEMHLARARQLSLRIGWIEGQARISEESARLHLLYARKRAAERSSQLRSALEECAAAEVIYRNLKLQKKMGGIGELRRTIQSQ